MNGKEVGVLEKPEEGYVASVEAKKNLKYKAAPGVTFVVFDEYGMNKAEGLSQYISTDNNIPDVFIEAPPEMVAKALKPQGVFRDYDKELKDLNKEGKLFLNYTNTLVLQKRKFLIVCLIQIKRSVTTMSSRTTSY